MNSQPAFQDHEHNHLGHYLLGRTIGEGTFSKVKRATHLPTGETVAVKMIDKSKLSDVGQVDRVTRQMHLLRIVRHPSIVQLYQIIETQKYLFFITEYLQGGQLFELIVGRGHLSQPEACLYFRQLIAGLQYMKSLCICHRDLKPENLLLDEQKRLKISDFGLSNTYDEGQLLSTACGSPCYAAPEMLVGKKYEGTAVDIWSSGIILFAMVCGYLPYEDENTHKLYQKIMKEDLCFPTKVSHHFRNLIGRLLEVNPQKRLTLEEIQAHPWLQISQEIIPIQGIKVGSQSISVDPAVLKALKNIGFDSSHTKISIEANKQGADLAAYYLQMKKMKRQGYQSSHDINSAHFKFVEPAERMRQSFENTRKSYYFGLHDISPKHKSKSKSRKGKSSPSKSELSGQKRKKIKFWQENKNLSTLKVTKISNKKPMKNKMQLTFSKQFNKKKPTKLPKSGESPLRSAFYYTISKHREGRSSNKKQRKLWREKKNKSCSLIQRYS